MMMDVNRFMEIATDYRKIFKNENIHEIRNRLGDINKQFDLIGNITINGDVKKNKYEIQKY